MKHVVGLFILIMSFHAYAQTPRPVVVAPLPRPLVIDVKPAKIDMFKKSDIQSLIKLQRKELSSGRSGGDWGSSGGGSGVACFSDSATAQMAGRYIDDNQMLPPEMMAKIQSLETLDYWEWKTIAPFKLFQSNAQSADEIVKLVHYRLAQMVPLFVYRLEQTGELIEIKDWDAKAQVSRIYDAHPARPLPDQCRLVQLAARFTRDSYDFGAGPSKYIPLVKVELNQSFFEKLDMVNKAILILHEQLYLLGQLIGYKSSDLIRGAVMNFMSEDFGNRPGGPAVERHFLKGYLVDLFGDYLNYFGEDLKLSTQAYSQESRFNSYYEMLNRLRDKISLCEEGLMPEGEKIKWRTDLQTYTCKDYVMNPNLYKQWLTDEMSFIYLSSYFLDFNLHQINSELLIVPFAENSYQKRAAKEVSFACQFLMENKDKFIDRTISDKAVRYCDGFMGRLFPKGKDQN